MSEIQKVEQPAEKKYFSLLPQNLKEAIDLADRYAKSGCVPKTYVSNPGAILVAWDFGGSLGLGLMQSLQAIAVINGMPSIWGDAMLAIVMASGLLEDIDESVPGQCTVKRKGKNPVTIKFSMQDAEVAGLTKKDGPWKQYPKRQLQMRNRAFALRDVFPDILKGMTIAEEVQDYVNPYPNAVDIEPKKFENVLTPKKFDAPVTDLETGEIMQDNKTNLLSASEMNEAIDLIYDITELRKLKDEALRQKCPEDSINKLDNLIAAGFADVPIQTIQAQKEYLANL